MSRLVGELYETYCILEAVKIGIGELDPSKVDPNGHKGRRLSTLKNLHRIEEEIYMYLEKNKGIPFKKYLMECRPKGKKKNTDITVEELDNKDIVVNIGYKEYKVRAKGSSNRKTIEIYDNLDRLTVFIKTDNNSYRIINGFTNKYNSIEVIDNNVYNVEVDYVNPHDTLTYYVNGKVKNIYGIDTILYMYNNDIKDTDSDMVRMTVKESMVKIPVIAKSDYNDFRVASIRTKIGTYNMTYTKNNGEVIMPVKIGENYITSLHKK